MSTETEKYGYIIRREGSMTAGTKGKAAIDAVALK